MDRKRIVVAAFAALFAIAVAIWAVRVATAEPRIEANIPAGPNARTEDAPDH